MLRHPNSLIFIYICTICDISAEICWFFFGSCFASLKSLERIQRVSRLSLYLLQISLYNTQQSIYPLNSCINENYFTQSPYNSNSYLYTLDIITPLRMNCYMYILFFFCILSFTSFFFLTVLSMY